jgi:hypothetical protein
MEQLVVYATIAHALSVLERDYAYVGAKHGDSPVSKKQRFTSHNFTKYIMHIMLFSPLILFCHDTLMQTNK